MFTKPIKHTPLKDVEELLKFSIKTEFCSNQRNRFCYLNGQFAFTDSDGFIHITPERTEIPTLLVAAGYEEGTLIFPGVCEEDKVAYAWLEKIANEENWAETYEKAYNLSLKRGIKEVELDTQKLRIKEILYCYSDADDDKKYVRMIDQFLNAGTYINVATYILVDNKTLLVCDEYGRTFLVKTKSVINDVVNALIDAGYKRTAYPGFYVLPLEQHI